MSRLRSDKQNKRTASSLARGCRELKWIGFSAGRIPRVEAKKRVNVVDCENQSDYTIR